MYAAKVRVRQQPTRSSLEAEHSGAAPSADAPSEDDAIAFTAGNPRVEHITGVVHLFRQVELGQDASAPPPTLPEGHGDSICVLTMPPDLGVAEFCTFVGAYLQAVRGMRIVRREGPKQQCLVLLRFDSVKTAALFFKDYNAKPFSSLEPDVLCQLVFIKDLEILSGQDCDPVRPPPGQTELPSCPVCLERLDQHISGVVTTVCNHRFHNECLRQWGDESCPVCRYCATAGTTTSYCTTCGTSQDLWICLICGHVGCGRYRARHSMDHWRQSGHVYALELETQRVWDYVGDGYVHRLIQSKTDGKLVEVAPPPGPASGPSGADDTCSTAQPSGRPAADGDMQDALFASKVDAFAAEYNHLLVSQLDSQRQYYEGVLRRAEAESQAALADAGAATAAAGRAAEQAVEDARAAAVGRKTAERKLADANAKLAELRKERDFLKTLSDSVMTDQATFKAQLAAAEKRSLEQDARVAELEDQVRDLMIFIEARQAVAAGDASELQEGTLLAAEAKPPKRRGSARRK